MAQQGPDTSGPSRPESDQPLTNADLQPIAQVPIVLLNVLNNLCLLLLFKVKFCAFLCFLMPVKTFFVMARN